MIGVRSTLPAGNCIYRLYDCGIYWRMDTELPSSVYDVPIDEVNLSERDMRSFPFASCEHIANGSSCVSYSPCKESVDNMIAGCAARRTISHDVTQRRILPVYSVSRFREQAARVTYTTRNYFHPLLERQITDPTLLLGCSSVNARMSETCEQAASRPSCRRVAEADPQADYL